MIRDAIEIAGIHLERLKQSIQEIESLENLENVDLKDFEVVKTIDTLIFRFMKLQDYKFYANPLLFKGEIQRKPLWCNPTTAITKP